MYLRSRSVSLECCRLSQLLEAVWMRCCLSRNPFVRFIRVMKFSTSQWSVGWPEIGGLLGQHSGEISVVYDPQIRERSESVFAPWENHKLWSAGSTFETTNLVLGMNTSQTVCCWTIDRKLDTLLISPGCACLVCIWSSSGIEPIGQISPQWSSLMMNTNG